MISPIGRHAAPAPAPEVEMEEMNREEKPEKKSDPTDTSGMINKAVDFLSSGSAKCALLGVGLIVLGVLAYMYFLPGPPLNMNVMSGTTSYASAIVCFVPAFLIGAGAFAIGAALTKHANRTFNIMWEASKVALEVIVSFAMIYVGWKIFHTAWQNGQFGFGPFFMGMALLGYGVVKSAGYLTGGYTRSL